MAVPKRKTSKSSWEEEDLIKKYPQRTLLKIKNQVNTDYLII